MATKAKSNSIITAQPAADSESITFTVLGAGDIKLTLANVSASVQLRAMIHGFTQRISDAAAIPRDTETGLSATAPEKFEAMRALVEHYESGTTDWARNRAAGGPRVDGETALILRAVAEHQGASVEDMRERVKTIAAKRELSVRDYLGALLASAQKGGALAPIAAAYERLKAAQPVRVVAIDADAAADELAGLGS